MSKTIEPIWGGRFFILDGSAPLCGANRTPLYFDSEAEAREFLGDDITCGYDESRSAIIKTRTRTIIINAIPQNSKHLNYVRIEINRRRVAHWEFTSILEMYIKYFEVLETLKKGEMK